MPMRRFFFHLLDGNLRLDDPEGTMLPDRASACIEALVSARAILRHELATEGLWDDCRFEIADEGGQVLDVVPLVAALRLH